MRCRLRAVAVLVGLASAICSPAQARAEEAAPATTSDEAAAPATKGAPTLVNEALAATDGAVGAGAAPGRALVRVHVSAPKTVTLQRSYLGRGDWVNACDSPCGKELAVADTYRVVYDRNQAASEPFRLAAPAGGAVDLIVTPPSKVGGTVLMAIGGAVGVAGLVGTIGGGYLIASSPSAADCAAQPQTDANRLCGIGRPLGAIILLPSLAVLLGGVALTVVGANVRSGAAPDTKQRAAAFVRQPTWISPEVGSAGKRGVMMPLRFSF